MQKIKQSTPIAADRRVYFTAVSAAALQTRLADADLGTWVVYISKNGAAGAVSSSPSTVEVDSTNKLGEWYVQLSIADCDTPGKATIKITNTDGSTAMEPREYTVEIEQAFMATVSAGTATAITCDRIESTADYWKDSLVLAVTGANAGQVKKIGGYATGLIALATGFTFASNFTNGDVIEIISR